MKHRLLIIKNIIPVVFFIACLFCLSAYSQNSEAEIEIDEKEQREVEKFADEFIASLESTYDLNQVPDKFFAAGFRERLAKNDTWDLFSESENLREQLGSRERYQNNVSFINLFNLVGIFFSEYDKQQSENNDSDGGHILKRSLPPHIFKLFTEGKWTRTFIKVDENNKNNRPNTPADYRTLMTEVNAIGAAMREEIKSRRLKFPRPPDGSDNFFAEKCKGEECMGLPENTTIFFIHRSSMCLRISKVNDELKIFNISNIIVED